MPTRDEEPNMSRQNRRDFLKCAAAGGLAAFTIAGTKASGRVLGANDRVRIAVAGINGRGQEHMHEYLGMKHNVEIIYLVDPDSRLFESRSKMVNRRTGSTPKCVQDIRKVLDDKNLDAISIATPNHWHSLMTIWACQAGKDVYVEKPCSHNVHEGRMLVEAARKYDRIVQHGTQSRSIRDWADAVAAVRSGQVRQAAGRLRLCYKPRGSIGFKQPKTPPKELDFNIWLGPAPKQPYHDNLVHYNWHWFWDFGNGDIGNQGVHQMDIARWAIPDGAVPTSVISLGGRFGYKDQGQTPNTQITVMDFGDAQLIFEVRGLVDGKTTKVTNEFYMEGGVIKGGLFFPKGKGEGEKLKGVSGAELYRRASLSGNSTGLVGLHVSRPAGTALQQFHRLCSQPQARKPQCGNRRRIPFGRALPLGKPLLSAGHGGALQRRDEGPRRRQGRRRIVREHEAALTMPPT